MLGVYTVVPNDTFEKIMLENEADSFQNKSYVEDCRYRDRIFRKENKVNRVKKEKRGVLEEKQENISSPVTESNLWSVWP